MEYTRKSKIIKFVMCKKNHSVLIVTQLITSHIWTIKLVCKNIYIYIQQYSAIADDSLNLTAFGAIFQQNEENAQGALRATKRVNN